MFEGFPHDQAVSGDIHDQRCEPWHVFLTYNQSGAWGQALVGVQKELRGFVRPTPEEHENLVLFAKLDSWQQSIYSLHKGEKMIRFSNFIWVDRKIP